VNDAAPREESVGELRVTVPAFGLMVERPRRVPAFGSDAARPSRAEGRAVCISYRLPEDAVIAFTPVGIERSRQTIAKSRRKRTVTGQNARDAPPAALVQACYPPLGWRVALTVRFESRPRIGG
jgi:hypothetical protein